LHRSAAIRALRRRDTVRKERSIKRNYDLLLRLGVVSSLVMERGAKDNPSKSKLCGLYIPVLRSLVLPAGVSLRLLRADRLR
jgi:hypothetical protein